MEQFKIDDLNIMTIPLKPRMCLRLDRKITGLIMHTLGGKDKIDLQEIESVDVNSLLNNFIDALNELDDKEYMQLVLALLVNTQVWKDNQQASQVSNEDSFDTIFEGVSILSIYKLLVKVMEINKFTPFVLAEEMGFKDLIGGLTGSPMTETSS